MMTYDQFYQATDIPHCGRGKLLKALGDRVRACDAGLTVPRGIAVLTAASAWGWKKGAKHRDHPTVNFNQRLRAIRTLVQEAEQDLTNLGVDGPAIARAANSYEKHKTRGVKKGLQTLGKGYHYERKDFEAAKKGTGFDKDSRVTPRAGSFVAEALKSAKDLRANYKQQVADGLQVQDVLGQAVTDEKMLKVLLSKDIHQLSPSDFDNVFDAANLLAGQNTPEVNFLRKTERVEKFLTWCDNGLFYKKPGHPYSSAGREIYAMDKYGNLITMKPDLRFNPGNTSYSPHGTVQHNHSSLNAGGEVISAGEIEFQNGYITYIDNASGHYKPTARQLQNCVFSLSAADDADLTRLQVNAWYSNNWHPYTATQFLATKL
jgi:hypothetical protein